jgi:hypothetical protein
MGEGTVVGESGLSERTAKAAQRVEELRRRRAELAAGERPSRESVNFARQRAKDALHRAEEAHRASAQRHEELARIHERAANSYQLAAMRGDDRSPSRLQQEADRHWQAAHDSHLRFAEDEAKAEDTKNSSSG